jgi:2-polyprenyl-3-methyl-5-hydroxy-6-metoxy-1,4-benzoquinol methylase
MSILSEKDIRPNELMAERRIATLTDLGRMLSRCKDFVHVECPACGSKESTSKFEKNGITYVDCKLCQTFYVNPRPTSDILDWFYKESANYSFWNEFIFPASEAKRLERIFIPRVDNLIKLCTKYKINTDAILEVGAGFGTFCVEIKRRNIFKRVVAVEPTPDLAITCRKRGLEVFELPIEKVQLEATELFDVVASFEVIEHLFAPIKFLEHMTRLLKPKGLILLVCPNGQGFDIETLGALSDTIDHEHLNYFNPKSLANLLLRCGLEILESFTPGELDADLVRNKILSGEFDISSQPFLKKILIDDWVSSGSAFQDFLIQQSMSSNMCIVARKS